MFAPRSLLVLAAAVLAAAVLPPNGAAAQDAPRPPRPDILLVMPDQMRGDCLSILGHPVVSTPNFDALARAGALFRRAYSTVPSCIPARHSLLTGRFPQTSGVVGYQARPIDVPTLPHRLADCGYATALVGRNMHQVPPSASYGYQQRILGSTYVAGDDYDRALRKAAPDAGGIRALVKSLGLTNNQWQAAPWPLAGEFHPTAWIVRQSLEVVATTPLEQPLFLTTSTYAPHPPLFPPKPVFDRLSNSDLPEPAHGDWVDWQSRKPEGDRKGHRIRLEGETLRRAQAGYFGLIEHLDAQIGPLIAAFRARSEKAGRAWLVVVTSDHGEMLGDHGFYRKCEPYEGSANIPLVIAGSEELGFRAGVRCERPVGLEDIMPTLLELAGAEVPDRIDGISLLPTLRGEQDPIRAQLHFEHAPCYDQEQAFHALTDGRFKYVWRPKNGDEQLFDLSTDPREERDLSKRSEFHDELVAWRRALVRRLSARPEGFSDGERLIAGREYLPLIPPVERR